MTMALNDDIYFMRQALAEARKAYDADEVPIGAVVVCGGNIVGRGHNLTECLNDVTAHAEMQAITAAANTLGGKYLADCTLYGHGRAVSDVCRRNRLEPVAAHSNRCARCKARICLSDITLAVSSQGGSGVRCA